MMCARYLTVVLFMFVTTVSGARLVFTNNPLPGVPSAVGQIFNGAGGGPVFSFDPPADLIVFDPAAFGVNSIDFASGNTTDPGFPTGDLTVAVVRNAGAARAAATVLGDQLTTSGPGFFIYFNAGLNVPRLVFSRDLGDPNADLAILARFNNLSGQNSALDAITAGNFAQVPEPSGILLTSGAIAALGFLTVRRRARRM
jgi:hypothetical protein